MWQTRFIFMVVEHKKWAGEGVKSACALLQTRGSGGNFMIAISPRQPGDRNVECLASHRLVFKPKTLMLVANCRRKRRRNFGMETLKEGALTTGVAGVTRPRSTPIHPPFIDMVLEAIKTLRKRRGSSRQKIVKYIGENYRVGCGYEKQVNLALKRGVNRGLLLQVRGMGASGSFKINKGGPNGPAAVAKVN